MQFTDWFCRHKVCVLYAERLVTGTALFVNLHHEQFVIRQGELGQHEYTPHRGFPVHRYQAVVCPYRFYEVLLHGRALGYFLVHHFETDIVNVERYIRTVAQGSMQVQQVIIDIKPFEQCLYAVLLATDMPDVPFVLLIQPAGGSSGNPAAIAAGRATENVVSSLAVPPVPDTIPRNYGFATAVGGGQLAGANTIRACVAEDQTVTTGA